MLKKIKIIIEKYPHIANIAKFINKYTLLKYKKYKNNKLFLKNAKEALSQIENVFKELNIEYWLEFGTLLGAIRENGFISHDIDIDLGLWLKNYNENNYKVFEKYGFKRVRKITIDDGKYGLEETYKYNGMDIDLFYFKLKDNMMISHNFKNEDNMSWGETISKLGGLIVREKYIPYTKFTLIDFMGSKVLIPKDYDTHLKAIYGDSYMTPNPKWNPYKMEKNIKILKDKIGVVHSYD